MKGIVLAGGSGTRLYPITKGISKQLLSVYDKPMVYYPISVLMLSGIDQILIISSPEDLINYKRLLGDGKDFGVSFSYIEQPKPEGLAQAFILGKDFIGKDNVALVLGDNVFYGRGFGKLLLNSMNNVESNNRATIFAYPVKNPENFGVITINKFNVATSIVEKPKNPESNLAVVGLYFFPNNVVEYALKIKPSKRGELEISTINQIYLQNNNLDVQHLGRGFTWLDTGTHDSLLEASNFVKTTEKHTGYKIGCLEEIALSKGFINKSQFKELINIYSKTPYGTYLNKILNEN